MIAERWLGKERERIENTAASDEGLGGVETPLKAPRGDTRSQCCSEGLLPTSEKGIPERTKTELAT